MTDPPPSSVADSILRWPQVPEPSTRAGTCLHFPEGSVDGQPRRGPPWRIDMGSGDEATMSPIGG